MGWFGDALKSIGGNLLSNAGGNLLNQVISGVPDPLSSVFTASPVSNNVPGLVDTPSLLANAASNMDPTGGGGGFDVGNLLSGVTVSPQVPDYGTISPVADPFTTQAVTGVNPFDPSFVNTPATLANSAAGITSPFNPLSILQNPTATAAPVQNNVPGLVNTPQTLATAAAGIGGGASPVSTAGGAPATASGIDVAGITKLLAGLGLGAGALSNNGLGPDADALRAMAADNESRLNGQILPTALANQQGMINGQALNTIQTSLNQKLAAIRKAYAGMGESGSTMEAQDMNAARTAATDQTFATGQEMATSGLSEATSLAGLDQGIYNNLMNAQISQDKDLQDAIAAFAGAVSK